MVDHKEYNLEELIELAKQPASSAKKEVDPETSEAYKFVSAVGIKRGVTKVTHAQIYQLYGLWAKEAAINSIEFARQFGKIFKRNRDSNGSYYMLSSGPFEAILNGNKEESETQT